MKPWTYEDTQDEWTRDIYWTDEDGYDHLFASASVIDTRDEDNETVGSEWYIDELHVLASAEDLHDLSMVLQQFHDETDWKKYRETH